MPRRDLASPVAPPLPCRGVHHARQLVVFRPRRLRQGFHGEGWLGHLSRASPRRLRSLLSISRSSGPPSTSVRSRRRAEHPFVRGPDPASSRRGSCARPSLLLRRLSSSFRRADALSRSLQPTGCHEHPRNLRFPCRLLAQAAGHRPLRPHGSVSVTLVWPPSSNGRLAAVSGRVGSGSRLTSGGSPRAAKAVRPPLGALRHPRSIDPPALVRRRSEPGLGLAGVSCRVAQASSRSPSRRRVSLLSRLPRRAA